MAMVKIGNLEIADALVDFVSEPGIYANRQ